MGTQNKIPYQHNHLIMSTPSPSTPSPPKRRFPNGFVIYPRRVSDLLHFITRNNYSSYHPVRYPYNTKNRHQNLIILTSDCNTSQLMWVRQQMSSASHNAYVYRSSCLILALLIDGWAIQLWRFNCHVSHYTYRIHPWRGVAWHGAPTNSKRI